MFAKGHPKLGGRRAGVPNKSVASIGRPTIYNEELAAEICSRISEGTSLRYICAEAGMPDRCTILASAYYFPGIFATNTRARAGHGRDGR